MKMLHGEGLAYRPVGTCFEPPSPETTVSVPAGGEVQRSSVRRPVGPILGLRGCNRNPGAFGNWFRSVEGCDRDVALVWSCPNCKADPAIVGRKPAVEHIVIGMLQERSLLARTKVQNVDLIWVAAVHRNRLLVVRPVGSSQASFT